MSGLRRLLVAACVVGGGLLAAAPGAAAAGLNWKPCAFADAGSQCATAHVPRDYDHPNGDKLSIDVAKSPATGPGKKIGSLFFNFGGPGAFAAPYVEFIGHDLFPMLNERFDIVGMDPRGTDIDLDSENSVDCQTRTRRRARVLLRAVHDAVQPRRRPADQEGHALHLELHQEQRAEPAASTPRRPTSPATSTSCARRSATTR